MVKLALILNSGEILEFDTNTTKKNIKAVLKELRFLKNNDIDTQSQDEFIQEVLHIWKIRHRTHNWR